MCVNDKGNYHLTGGGFGWLGKLGLGFRDLRYEAAEWSAVPQALVTTAINEGVVLYEREG